MDGVLIDSEPLHLKAEKHTLSSFGVQPTNEELHLYMGTDAQTFCGELIKKYHLQITIRRLIDLHYKNLASLFEKEVQLKPGIIQLLQELKEYHIRLAVASSSYKSLVDLVLKKFHINPFFPVVVTGDEIERGKPYPDIFLETIKRLHVEVQYCVVIEDSMNGVRAAKRAGIKCLGLKDPGYGDQNLNEADLVVEDLQEVHYHTLIDLVG